ncbi:MAG: Maf family protein [Candidatus Kariarchaeaceae archaeon]
MELILASASSGRKMLLDMLKIDFKIIPSGIEEKIDSSLSLSELTISLAKQKAEAISASHSSGIILAADTMVSLNNHQIGKPKDEEDAFRILSLLQGKKHAITTGVYLINTKTNDHIFFSETTFVTMASMSPEEINEYIKVVQPFSYAGGYVMLGKSAPLIEKIEGDWTNVIGLPIPKIEKYLKKLGFSLIYSNSI